MTAFIRRTRLPLAPPPCPRTNHRFSESRRSTKSSYSFSVSSGDSADRRWSPALDAPRLGSPDRHGDPLRLSSLRGPFLCPSVRFRPRELSGMTRGSEIESAHPTLLYVRHPRPRQMPLYRIELNYLNGTRVVAWRHELRRRASLWCGLNATYPAKRELVETALFDAGASPCRFSSG